MYGDHLLFCAPLTADSERGPCFVQDAACTRARGKDEAAYAPCEATGTASCFIAQSTVDNSHVTVCSVSEKGCEPQRTQYETDPDFTKVPHRCSVYRQGDGRPPHRPSRI